MYLLGVKKRYKYVLLRALLQGQAAVPKSIPFKPLFVCVWVHIVNVAQNTYVWTRIRINDCHVHSFVFDCFFISWGAATDFQNPMVESLNHIDFFCTF